MTVRHLTALLLNDFEVHAVGCADIARTVKKGKVQNRFNFKAESEHDAVEFLYDDQIDEAVAEGHYDSTETAITVYASSIRFFPCCQLQWGKPAPAKSEPGPALLTKAVNKPGRQPTKAKPRTGKKQLPSEQADKAQTKRKADNAKAQAEATNGTKLTRDQKRQLAHAILTAADCVMDQLAGVGLKDVDQDEAAKTVAQWLHHLPVDHEWYVTTMKYLPKPDRSDWR